MNNKFYLKIVKPLIAIAPVVILFFLIKILYPERMTINNLVQAMTQAITPSILALGVACSFKVGNWDMAVGAEAALAAIIGGNIAIKLNLGFPGIMVACTLVGLLCGIITGLVFWLLKVPSIIVTIGMMLLMEDMTTLVFDGAGIKLPSELIVANKFPFNVIVLLVSMGITYYLLYRRRIGYHIKAVSNNINLTKMSGLDVYKIKIICFSLAGMFAGVYAFMNLGTTGIVKAVSNSMGSLSVAFGAFMCMFAGIALSKLVNMVIGIYIGGILIQLIKMGLMVLGISSAYQQVVMAFLVIVFMSLSSRGDLFTFKRIKLKKAAQQYKH